MLNDDDPRPAAQHLHRFTQDQLDHARILLRLLRQRHRARRGHDVGQTHAPAFGLGDYFLRQHQHVAELCDQFGATQACDDQRGQIVTRAYRRYARQCGEDHAARHPDGAVTV